MSDNSGVPDIDSLLPLRPVIFEMLLLLNEKNRHGYGMMQELKNRSAGRWILGPGTLYRTINEMLDRGLIESTGEERTEVAGRKRRYYCITTLGKQVAAAEASRMRSLVDAASEGKLI